MRLTLSEPKYLKDSISIISELVNEAKLKISRDGIELVAMDPANVAMVIFKLLPTAFTEYDVEKPADIAINLANLRQIMRRAGPSDMLTLELDSNKLKVQLKSSSTRTFSLPIIDMEDKDQKVPELSFPVNIELDSTVFNEAVNDADIVSESVNLVAEPGKLTLQAEGDLNSAAIEIRDSESAKVVAKEKTKAKYSIEYLKKMIEGSKLSDRVLVQFNKDYPLRITYSTVDKVMMAFILAPRVDTD
ncbi:proliferating cell nuclear antigen (pcna) [Candidatus Woesearchaeota archaeon]|nr:proliferating cell nuclear antigen (pcna) [Candidatus Woesearchaeota archaeon]